MPIPNVAPIVIPLASLFLLVALPVPAGVAGLLELAWAMMLEQVLAAPAGFTIWAAPAKLHASAALLRAL